MEKKRPSRRLTKLQRELDRLQIEEYIATGTYQQPTQMDRYHMMRRYYDMLLERRERDSVGKMKQFATYFTHGIRGGARTTRPQR